MDHAGLLTYALRLGLGARQDCVGYAVGMCGYATAARHAGTLILVITVSPFHLPPQEDKQRKLAQKRALVNPTRRITNAAEWQEGVVSKGAVSLVSFLDPSDGNHKVRTCTRSKLVQNVGLVAPARDALVGGRLPPPPPGLVPTPPPSRAPSLCPATVSLTASASFNGICNRQ